MIIKIMIMIMMTTIIIITIIIIITKIIIIIIIITIIITIIIIIIIIVIIIEIIIIITTKSPFQPGDYSTGSTSVAGSINQKKNTTKNKALIVVHKHKQILQELIRYAQVMSCHRVIVVIIRRTDYFLDYM